MTNTDSTLCDLYVRHALSGGALRTPHPWHSCTLTHSLCLVPLLHSCLCVQLAVQHGDRGVDVVGRIEGALPHHDEQLPGPEWPPHRV